jgi:Radical SAM superfamily/4Fe-4S single cluster domain
MEKRRWVPSVTKVEIEICTGCNLRCANCDRSVRQAPSNEYMTVEQISRFVDESIDLDWGWERITVLGGEPTLHPTFWDLLSVLGQYRHHNPTTIFRIYSNGFGKAVQKTLCKMPPWFEIKNTNKTRRSPLFSAYNVAPIDLPEYDREDFTKACVITSWCGLGLTRYGYYPCGAGASLDRVFGFDIGIKRLADVTQDRLKEQLRVLCARCGHYRDFDARVEYIQQRDERLLVGWTNEERISPTWAIAYKNYKLRPPGLSLY